MTLNAKAERQLGFDTKTIVRSTYYITDEFDLDILAFVRKSRLFAFVLTYALFIWICLTADRVHAYVDGGLLISSQKSHFNQFELFLYKILKIKLFVWAYGADVRKRKATLELGEPNCCTDCPAINIFCVCDEKIADDNYKRILSVATAIFSMGDMTEYTPKSRNNLFYWPVDLNCDNGNRYLPSYPSTDMLRPLRVVHAPNHRQFKGTQYLEAAVNELKNEGVSIDLILVEKVPNDEALLIYRSADVIFDQCLIGFHGYFTIESMALGKPVICYIRYPKKYLLGAKECPIVNVHRDDLKTVLRRMATTDRESLTDIGRQSRAYIEQYYTLDAFATRLRKCYEDMGVIA